MLNAKILIVDDMPDNVELLKNFLRGRKYEILEADNGREALEKAQKHHPDLILMDAVMPVMDGFEVSERLKADSITQDIPVIMITGLSEVEDHKKALRSGVDDILVKPINHTELNRRVQTYLKIKNLDDRLKQAEEIIFQLALALESKDPFAHGHRNRIANYSMIVGQSVGLPDEDIEVLRKGSILHDIGKLAIQDTIMLKPGPLSDAEFNTIKQHPVFGSQLLQPFPQFENVQPIVLMHHERLDGSGYPNGLQGDDIPYLSQIVSLADTYDTLLSNRPYRKAMSKKEALSVMDKEVKKGKFDRALFKEFKAVLKKPGLRKKIENNSIPIRPFN